MTTLLVTRVPVYAQRSFYFEVEFMAKRKRTEEIKMVSIKEMLRLLGKGRSWNEIAASCGVARSTAQDYIKKILMVGLTYEEACNLGEEEICRRLRIRQPRQGSGRETPKFEKIHQDLSGKGVTLQLLWEEYRRDHPTGYSYSNLNYLYRKWRKEHKLSLRQTYKAGEKMLVDYSGMKVMIYSDDGKMNEAEIFVAVLGASNYTYSEASPSQELANWLGSHERALRYLGGVPEIEVIDNLKSGVNKSCRYEPELNRSFAEFAEHYGLTVIPTRVISPRDKAKVEEAVQNVQRRILAQLRDRRFVNIPELNQAMRPLLEDLNSRVMKIYGVSRRELFEKVDKPALSPLPTTPFEFGSWKIATVNIDYHIELKRHYYSVPYKLVGQRVDIRFSEKTVAIFHDGKRIVEHLRGNTPGKHTTLKEHMPPQHQYSLDWTPSRFVNWGNKLGLAVGKQIEAILASRSHPEQAYRSCLGLLRLEKKFGAERLNAACNLTNSLGVASMKSVQSILTTGRDKLQGATSTPKTTLSSHDNIRGDKYYH